MESLSAALYIRVSSAHQNVAMQRTELIEFAKRRHWKIAKVYADEGFSGTRQRRPGLDLLLADCRQRKVDVVCVWKVDRLGRSLHHLISTLLEFRTLGISFVSYTEGIDSTSPQSGLLFNILG